MLKIQKNVIQVTCCPGTFWCQRVQGATLISYNVVGGISLADDCLALYVPFIVLSCTASAKRLGKVGSMLSDTFDLFPRKYLGLASQRKEGGRGERERD